MEYFNNLNDFYTLKAKYDKNVSKLKKKILKNESLNKKQKQDKFLNLQPKCIQCKNPVGTIFKIEKDRYIAICGANEKKDKGFSPCKLNINIKRENFENLENNVEKLKKENEESLEKIIRIKINLLFRLIDESDALEQFEKEKLKFDNINVKYQKELTDLINITQLIDKKDEINKITLEIYEQKNELKEILKDKNIKEYVEIYINKLMPLIEKESSLKYIFRIMDIDTKNNMSYLKEYPYTIENLELKLAA